MASRGLVIGGAIAAVVVVGGIWVGGTYNSLVGDYQQVEFTYSQVQNVLNRQFNVIKGMSQVAERYAQHEQNTFVGTAQGRGGVEVPAPVAAPKAASANPSEVANNPELQKQLAQSDQAVQGFMMKINAAQEAYPNLKADTQFEKLMTEMEGSTNRVAVERRRNLQAVQNFNNKVLHFPTNVAASFTGYHSLPYYKAEDNQQELPDVFKK